MSQPQKYRRRIVLPRLQKQDAEPPSSGATTIDEQVNSPVADYDSKAAYERLLEDLPPKRAPYLFVVLGTIFLMPALFVNSSERVFFIVFGGLPLLVGSRILYLHHQRKKLERSRQRKSNFDD